MAMLSLYVHPQGRVILHRRGFSWLAALHPSLWALRRKMWVTAVAILVLMPNVYGLAFEAIDLLPPGRLRGLIDIGWLLLCAVLWGMLANYCHRKYLELRGYRLMATEAKAAVVPEMTRAE